MTPQDQNVSPEPPADFRRPKRVLLIGAMLTVIVLMPSPFAPGLEQEYLPKVDDVIAAVDKVLERGGR